MEERICPLCGTSDKIVEIVREGKVNEEIDNPYRCEGCGCEFGKIYGFMYNAIKEVSLAVEKDLSLIHIWYRLAEFVFKKGLRIYNSRVVQI